MEAYIHRWEKADVVDERGGVSWTRRLEQKANVNKAVRSWRAQDLIQAAKLEQHARIAQIPANILNAISHLRS